MPGAVRLLQASCRSCLSAVFALAADVAPLHRFVPDECVFSFQGAFFFSLCNNSVVTSHILEKKKRFAVGLAAHIFALYKLSATEDNSCITARSRSRVTRISSDSPLSR